MKKIIQENLKILEDLKSYYGDLKEYIKFQKIDPKDEIPLLIDKATLQGQEALTIEQPSAEGAFHAVHLMTSIRDLLSDIYNKLNFELQVGEEISTNRKHRLTDVFKTITSFYTKMTGLEIPQQTVSEKDPQLLYTWWSKWPLSIDLFARIMNKELNEAYRVPDFSRVNLILGLVEKAKTSLLETRPILEPFMSLLLIPHRETTLPIGKSELDALLEKDPTTTGATRLIITRQNKKNRISTLVDGLSWKSGLSTDLNVGRSTLMTQKKSFVKLENKEILWSIELKEGSSKDLLVIEDLGEQFRVLVPRSSSRFTIAGSDPLVEKIRNKDFGLPLSYNLLLSGDILSKCSTRVANLAIENYAKEDFGVKMVKIQHDLSKFDGVKSSEVQIDDILNELEQTLLGNIKEYFHHSDLLLFWIEFAKKEFKKEYLIGTSIRTILENLILHKSSILNEMLEKQHLLRIVSENS